MNIKITFIFLIAINTSFIFGQNKEYKQVKFTNLTPIWTYAPIDSTLIGKEGYTGRNHFINIFNSPIPHFIDDDFLYIAHHTGIISEDVEGALLEKINLKNGSVVWQQRWDLRNSNRQEWVESIFKNTKGELIVVTAQRIKESTNNFAIYGDTCLISIRKFSTEDGNLLKHIKIDESNEQSLRIRNNGLIFKSILYPINEDKFQYYSLSLFHEKLSFYNIDDNGHQLTNVLTDTLKEVDINDYDIQFDRNMFKVSQDTLIMLDYYFNKINPNIDTQTIIKIYDKDLHITNHFKIDSLLNYRYKRLFLVYANHDYIFIRGKKNPDSSNIGSIFYIILNYSGGVERKFTAVYNGKKHFFDLPLKLKQEKEYLFTSQNNYYYGLDFIKTTSSDSLKVLGEFYYDNINYGYSPSFLWQLKNKDILSYGITTYYDEGRYIGICPTIMRIKAKDLGLQGTSTIEITIDNNNLSISPNPAINHIKISSKKSKINRLYIFDMFGRLVMEKKIAPNIVHSLNISKIPKGIYIVKTFNSKNKYESVKFVKQ